MNISNSEYNKEAFQERLNKFRQLTTQPTHFVLIEPHTKKLGNNIVELKNKFENITSGIPTLTTQNSVANPTKSKLVIPKIEIPERASDPKIEEIAAPIIFPIASNSKLEILNDVSDPNIEEIASPIRSPVAIKSKEYPDHRIVRKQSPDQFQLERLYAILTERTAENTAKCRSGFYLTFENGEYAWKPMSNFPKLTKNERKELKVALENLLKTLNYLVDKHKIVEFTVGGSGVSLPALVLRIVDYPIETPAENRVCVHFLNRKKNCALRQAVIKFIHKCTYYEPLKEAKEIKKFLDDSHKTLKTLIDTLSGLQLESISKKIPEILEIGLEKLPAHVSKSEAALQREEKAKKATQRILTEGIISPRLSLLVEKRQKHIAEANEMFKALRTGLECMRASGKNRFVKNIGISSTYKQLNTEDGKAYLFKVLGKPEKLMGCYDEVTITSLSENLSDYKRFVEHYISIHENFAQSELGMREYLKTSDFPKARKEKAKEAYRSGDYGECLRVLFHLGGITLQLKALLKDLARRSVEKLAELEVSVKLNQDFTNCEWDKLSQVFASLTREFANLNRA